MLYAIFKYPENGTELSKKKAQEQGLVLNEKYEVVSVNMGSFYTNILLKGYNIHFNSVQFDFEEDGEPIDIYSDRRFNPYL